MAINKDKLRSFIIENNLKTTDDIEDALKAMFGEMLQTMLEGEMEAHLGYSKNDKAAKQTPNRRNGHTSKAVRTRYGDVDLQTPRDRDGDFEPKVVKKRQKTLTNIEEQVIALYSHGLSCRDIQEHLHTIYGVEASPALISHITDKALPLAEAWQCRPLEPVYALVFLDAVHYKVRESHRIITKAAYVAIGVSLDGMKDVLGVWIGASESAKFWLGVLSDLKSRGVKDILIACTDNLSGFTEAIAAVYPQCDTQKCVIHQIRSSTRYVVSRDRQAVMASLKPIYQAATKDEALLALAAMEEAWGKKYPHMARSWRDNWEEVSTFFDYPPEIRRLIYTTNIIESFHRQLRKVTKTKGSLPTDDALFKMLYLVTHNVTKRWTSRIAGWAQILPQLEILFQERISKAYNSNTHLT